MKCKAKYGLLVMAMLCWQQPGFAMVKEAPEQGKAVKSIKANVMASELPEQAYEDMGVLVKQGIVKLPAGVVNVNKENCSKNDMTIMTMQAIQTLNLQDTTAKGLTDDAFKQQSGVKEVMNLKEILAPELKNYGMKAEKLATSTQMSSEATDAKRDEERKWKISGEIRYSYDHNSGAPQYQWKDSRLRLRLYLEAKINNDWHAFGMLERNKHFLSQHDNDDDWYESSRWYVRGLTGATVLTAGRFGYMIGEGNIYDSSITGIVANVGDPVNYEVMTGKTEAHGWVYSLLASYKTDQAEYGLGLAKFNQDDWNTGDKVIGHAYANYWLNDKWKVGIMGLTGNKADEDGRKNGFVTTVQYGKLATWEKGSYEVDLKYYRQPMGTYVAHTMTGLGGYMDGFRGPGAMWYYTLFPNVVLGVEYYDLEDLVTGEKGRTLWTQVSYYF